jgi:hypothetical protein
MCNNFFADAAGPVKNTDRQYGTDAGSCRRTCKNIQAWIPKIFRRIISARHADRTTSNSLWCNQPRPSARVIVDGLYQCAGCSLVVTNPHALRSSCKTASLACRGIATDGYARVSAGRGDCVREDGVNIG